MRACLLALLVCACWREGWADPLPNGGCQRPEVLLKAGRAVDQINQERTEGYIFGLNRVYDVTYKNAVISKMTVDVMETGCYVYSRKPWTQCEGRGIGAVPVEGQCILTFNGASMTYTCTIRPVSPAAIVRVCPDCPTGAPVNNQEAVKTVDILLKKYNRDSGPAKPFSLLSITLFSKQYMFGPSFLVQFTIKDNISGQRGFCKGSRFSNGLGQEDQNVECDLYKAETSPPPKPSGSVMVLPPLDIVPPRPTPTAAQCPSVQTFCVLNCK